MVSRKSSLASIPNSIDDEAKQNSMSSKIEEKLPQPRSRSQTYSYRNGPTPSPSPEKKIQKISETYSPVKIRPTNTYIVEGSGERPSKVFTYSEVLLQKPLILKQPVPVNSAFSINSNSPSPKKSGPYNPKAFTVFDNNIMKNREVSSITKVLTSVKPTEATSAYYSNLKDFRASLSLNEDSKKTSLKNTSLISERGQAVITFLINILVANCLINNRIMDIAIKHKIWYFLG